MCILILWFYLGLSVSCWANGAILFVLRAPKIGKQCTAVKRKHITLTVLQELIISRRLESGQNQRKAMASYNIGLLTVYDIKKHKDQLRLFMVSSGSMKDLLKR